MAARIDIGTVNARLGLLQRLLPTQTAAALYEVGQEVMTASKAIVPVDTGALKGSGYVSEPKISGAQVTVEIGYGGPSTPYAIRQHEDLSLRHPGGGQAKFLEGPLSQVDLPRAIAERVRL
jgi:hypothetical protein